VRIYHGIVISKRNSSTKPGSVARVREFNRFYTKQIGVLQEGLLESPYSLTEARIMFELCRRADMTAAELADLLGINHGYLSRILKRFKSLGFIDRARSSADGRELLLNLTRKGRAAYAPLDARANAEVRQLLSHLSAKNRRKLLEAMDAVRRLLSHPTYPGERK
jgi:DNA-binding MarR family transcriptional regulator